MENRIIKFRKTLTRKGLFKIEDIEILSQALNFKEIHEEGLGYKKEWTILLETEKTQEVFSYTDSINNFKNKFIDLNDLLYCLLLDYRIVQDCSSDDVYIIATELINEFGYEFNQAKKIAYLLKINYDKINNLFSNKEVEKLIEYYEEY